MIIVTTKTATIFINDKDTIKIDYLKEKSEVMVFYRESEKADVIEDVLAVRYVTDAMQMNSTEVAPDLVRENGLLNLQVNILEHHIDYMRKQRATQTKAIEDIYQMSTSKDVNHKTAREHITKLCEKCISECEETYNEAKKNGIL